MYLTWCEGQSNGGWPLLLGGKATMRGPAIIVEGRHLSVSLSSMAELR